jgi:hypothetical protein
MRKVLVAAVATTAVLAVTFVASPAEAGGNPPIVVATTDDVISTNPMSLRSAIGLAGSTPGPDVIQLPVGELLLDLCAPPEDGPDEDLNASGDLDHLGVSSVELRPTDAPGERVIRQACGEERIIESTGNIQLKGLVLTGGDAVGSGGAVLASGSSIGVDEVEVVGNSSGGSGGGLYAAFGVLVDESTIHHNAAAFDGGGIRVGESLTLNDSSVVDNEAMQHGGGIRGLGAGDIQVVRSTVGRNGAGGEAGGIYLDAGASVVLEDATVAQNEAGNGVGGIFAVDQVVSSQSTIAANITATGHSAVNTLTFSANETVITGSGAGGTCGAGTTVSDGWNVQEGGDDCEFDDATDEEGVADAGVLPLFANGGPTETAWFAADSPVLDLAPSTSPGCSNLGSDQRGVDRPQGSGCDTGAVEVEPCGEVFGDVSATHPFCWEIGWMSAAGVTTGFAGTPPTYKPSSSVTRQSMSAFLYRLAGSPSFEAPTMSPTFADVGATHPFFAEIEWMAEQGISTGTPGSPKPSYKPADAVSRQAMSAFMFRLVDDPTTMPPTVATFSDVGTGHPFFEEVEWMASEDITTGFPGNLFKPSSPVTRQSMSAFMYRLAPVLATREVE